MNESLTAKADSDLLAELANRKRGDSIEGAIHENSAIQQHSKFMEKKRGSNLTLPSKYSGGEHN